MCGINGFTWRDDALIRSMTGATAHRGPDGEGFFIDDRVSLGHNLLAITDTPQAGSQPLMLDERFVLTYNGEIYNYKELRTELERLGYLFHTQGDTEVLCRGLAHFGSDYLARLNGMFGLAFYDQKEGTLLVARDGMGKIPLYWHWHGGRLIWSSEFHGILKHPLERRLDHDMYRVFLELGYVPGSRTLIQGVHKLMPGQALTWTIGTGEPRMFFFAAPSSSLPPQGFSRERLGELVGQAVIDHTMGLRPFGMYLSGGLDSSIVLRALLDHGVHQVATYTTRFSDAPDQFNEDADLAARLSRDMGTRHQELVVTPDAFTDAIPQVIEAIEEPRYHPSLPAYWLMAQHASRDVTVILTGDGGDELFLGYPRYRESLRMSKRYEKYPEVFLDAYYSAYNWMRGKTPPLWLAMQDTLVRWWYFNRIISRRSASLYRGTVDSRATLAYLHALDHPAIRHPVDDAENALAELDRLFWLAEDSFVMTNKIGMRFGMEARFPLADQRVVEYAAAIPSRIKLSQGLSKGLLRDAYRGRLPEYVLKKKKSGWTAPVGHWMSTRLGEYMRQVIQPNWYAPTRELFDFDRINQDYLQGGLASSTKPFFTVFSFQIWAHQLGIIT